MSHPAVAEAAVIGVPSEKWTERPMACVVLKPDFVGKIEEKEILDFLATRVAKWWIPDEVAFVDVIPKTSVGKFAKRFLRTGSRRNGLPEPVRILVSACLLGEKVRYDGGHKRDLFLNERWVLSSNGCGSARRSTADYPSHGKRCDSSGIRTGRGWSRAGPGSITRSGWSGGRSPA